MGIIISRFRKKKTTADKLQDIEEKIKSIEKFQKETEQQFRKVVTKLVISSILVYIGAIVVYYYYFTPGTFKEHFFNFLPLIVFPIAIYFSRKMLSWYFERKLRKNEVNLKNLKATKKQILEEVMDKETYKVAKEILEKFAPEQLNKDATKPMNMNIRAVSPVTPKSDMTLRHRNVDPPTKRFNGSAPLPDVAFQAVPKPSSQLQPKIPLPRPVFPQNRGAFDKLIDMVVGDGPGSRYALICRMCSSHNGMALKHEFEYLAFRCAYCLQWNPARKQKPQAPNLVSESGSQDESDANNSEIEKINGDDSKSQNDCDVKAITAGEDTENQNQSNDSAQCLETEINHNSEKPSTEAIPDILSTSDITELQKPVDEPTADSPSEFRTKDTAIEEHSQIDSNTSTNTETDER